MWTFKGGTVRKFCSSSTKYLDRWMAYASQAKYKKSRYAVASDVVIIDAVVVVFIFDRLINVWILLFFTCNTFKDTHFNSNLCVFVFFIAILEQIKMDSNSRAHARTCSVHIYWLWECNRDLCRWCVQMLYGWISKIALAICHFNICLDGANYFFSSFSLSISCVSAHKNHFNFIPILILI